MNNQHADHMRLRTIVSADRNGFAQLATLVCGFVVATVLLSLPGVAEACPNCKDSLAESDPASLGIVQGFFWSIMLMLSMPALILGGLCTYFYVLVRHARRAAAAGPSPLVAESSSAESCGAVAPTQAAQSSATPSVLPSAPRRSVLPTWEEVMAREQAREQAGV